MALFFLVIPASSLLASVFDSVGGIASIFVDPPALRENGVAVDALSDAAVVGVTPNENEDEGILDSPKLPVVVAAPP